MYGTLLNSSDLCCFDADGTKKQTIFKFDFSSVFFNFFFVCVKKKDQSISSIRKTVCEVSEYDQVMLQPLTTDQAMASPFVSFC